MNAAVHVTGWMLLHFVWQGAAISAIATLMLRTARGASARLRYVVACIGLAAMLAMPFATAFEVARTGPAVHSSSIVTSLDESRDAAFAGPGRSATPAGESTHTIVPREQFERAFPLLVLTWLGGATTLLLRRWRRWRRVRAAHHGLEPESIRQE